MLRLTKDAVKTQLRAVDGVPVYGDGLEVSLVQIHCCQRLLVELGAEAAEDGFQLCTQSCYREALLRRQRQEGSVAVRLVQGLEDRRRSEACRSEWKHDGSSVAYLRCMPGGRLSSMSADAMYSNVASWLVWLAPYSRRKSRK